VREFGSNADALVLGCGVERTREAHKALLEILEDSNCPIVADAEALHAIASRPSICRGKKILLTPNAGEFKVLSKKSWPSSKKERTVSVRVLARQYGATVVVKGAEDYVSDGERVRVDQEGSPFLTKGGYGDLLAGVAGALLARGQSPFDAAKAAAYIVGRAGRIAAKRLGESTLASDTLVEVPQALSQRR
jgi:ADP-dependent NAD(P)H-hydrate dehydratase / NAD(P)H-hydrate epimerase